MFATQPSQTVLGPSERVTLASVIEAFAPPACDIAAVLENVEDKLSAIPARRRSQFIGLVQLLGTPVMPAALSGRPVPFHRLAVAERERLLLKMAHSDIPQLRAAFQPLRRLSLFMAYAGLNAAGSNPLWATMGYPGPRQDRPAHARTLCVVPSLPDRLEADVVVVGSGAGGGVSASLFAAGGRRVIVLEAGRHVESAQLTQREADMLGALYLDAASTANDDFSISILSGSCIGGGTTVNSAACLPLPEAVAEQWRSASGGIDFTRTLAPHTHSIARRLEMRPAQGHNRNNDVLARGCAALGWHIGVVQRNASGCGPGCGYCTLGCAYGCKRSTAATYLQDAAAAGATIVSGATVERVLFRAGAATGVEAVIAPAQGLVRRVSIRTPLVVLAAGSLRTPGILKRSGVSNAHVGRHLHLHPSSGVAAFFEQDIEPWHGVMQSAYSAQFTDLDEHYGALLEAVPVQPGQLSVALPWHGREPHAQLLAHARCTAALGAITRDRGEGHVTADAAERIHYRLANYDARHLLRAIDGLVDVAFAAGARRVCTTHAAELALERAHATAARRAAFRDAITAAGAEPNRLGLYSAHQMGTCRMHRDPRQGVVDEHGSVHGVNGLVVTDASVFPLASGVNPMLTIMALAHRSAQFHTGA